MSLFRKTKRAETAKVSNKPPKVATPKKDKKRQFAKDKQKDTVGEYRTGIESKILYLQTHLGHAPFHNLTFPKTKFLRYMDGLDYDAHDPGIVSDMVTDILRHYGMDPQYIRVEVEYIQDEANGEAPGTYTQAGYQHGIVRILINSSYHHSYDTIIAIACHECAHHYLFEHGINWMIKRKMSV